jgi:serine/threonine protein kinase
MFKTVADFAGRFSPFGSSTPTTPGSDRSTPFVPFVQGGDVSTQKMQEMLQPEKILEHVGQIFQTAGSIETEFSIEKLQPIAFLVQGKKGLKKREGHLYNTIFAPSGQVFTKILVRVKVSKKTGECLYKDFVHLELKSKTDPEKLAYFEETLPLYMEASHQRIAPKTYRLLDEGGKHSEPTLITELSNWGDFISCAQKIFKKEAETKRPYRAQLGHQFLCKVRDCHKSQIAHRDFKPDNILVHYDEKKEEFELKICDFGLAEKHESENPLTGLDRGSRDYQPPEFCLKTFYGFFDLRLSDFVQMGQCEPYLADRYLAGETLFPILTGGSIRNVLRSAILRYQKYELVALRLTADQLGTLEAITGKDGPTLAQMTLVDVCRLTYTSKNFLAFRQWLLEVLMDCYFRKYPPQTSPENIRVIKDLLQQDPKARITIEDAIARWQVQ